ncbi:MAG: hypothetical protein JKX93_03400 [Rhizobiaceae bacterium]|nr:hypothetical protein [Rhizobiaceae bacterium]
MISWKNTPIDNLSKKDLQLALAESVTHMMRGRPVQNSDTVAFAFFFGAVSSATLFALIFLVMFLTR